MTSIVISKDKFLLIHAKVSKLPKFQFKNTFP